MAINGRAGYQTQRALKHTLRVRQERRLQVALLQQQFSAEQKKQLEHMKTMKSKKTQCGEEGDTELLTISKMHGGKRYTFQISRAQLEENNRKIADGAKKGAQVTMTLAAIGVVTYVTGGTILPVLESLTLTQTAVIAGPTGGAAVLSHASGIAITTAVESNAALTESTLLLLDGAANSGGLKFSGGSGEGTGNSLDFNYDAKKIGKQMPKRGWTDELIEDTISNPSQTVKTRDTRWLPGADGPLDDPATGYIRSDGSYVVRNDRTGAITQVSNRNDPNWIAPWDMK